MLQVNIANMFRVYICPLGRYNIYLHSNSRQIHSQKETTKLACFQSNLLISYQFWPVYVCDREKTPPYEIPGRSCVGAPHQPPPPMPIIEGTIH